MINLRAVRTARTVWHVGVLFITIVFILILSSSILSLNSCNTSLQLSRANGRCKTDRSMARWLINDKQATCVKSLRAMTVSAISSSILLFPSSIIRLWLARDFCASKGYEVAHYFIIIYNSRLNHKYYRFDINSCWMFYTINHGHCVTAKKSYGHCAWYFEPIARLTDNELIHFVSKQQQQQQQQQPQPPQQQRQKQQQQWQ